MFYEDWTAVDGTVSTYEYTVDLSENTFTVDIYMNEEFEASGELSKETTLGLDSALSMDFSNQTVCPLSQWLNSQPILFCMSALDMAWAVVQSGPSMRC